MATPSQRIYFAHVHKAGGTSMCEMAKANGMKIVPGERNCNLPTPEGRNLIATGNETTQAIWMDRMERLHVSFLANEAGLPDVFFIAPGWRYVTILRDGAARQISQYLHVVNSLKVGGHGGEYENSPRLRQDFPNPRVTPPTLEAFLRYAASRRPLDNFQTRYFGGATIRAHTERLTEPDLTVAKRTLSRFHVVLRLDGSLNKLLRQTLGWNRTIRAGTINHAETQIPKQPNSTLALLASMNRLDDQLYAFAAEWSMNALKLRQRL